MSKTLTAGVILCAVLALSECSAMHSLTLRTTARTPELRSIKPSVLSLRGGADLEPEIKVGEDAQVSLPPQSQTFHGRWVE
eukprot:1433455-Rhodomonas_salina.1